MKQAVKLVANNKKAYHDYFIDEKFECGIELFGTEVKSIRMGKCSIKEAFVRVDHHNEIWVYGMHVNPYEKGNIFNKDPLRARKLLMHKNEILKLAGKIAEKGYTLVPLQVYFKGSLVKVEIGLARGKKLYDKRAYLLKKVILIKICPFPVIAEKVKGSSPLMVRTVGTAGRIGHNLSRLCPALGIKGILFRFRPQGFANLNL